MEHSADINENKKPARLPKEKLSWYRLNSRVDKVYAECDYCHSVMTKGRDGFGVGQCDNCLSELVDKINNQARIR